MSEFTDAYYGHLSKLVSTDLLSRGYGKRVIIKMNLLGIEKRMLFPLGSYGEEEYNIIKDTGASFYLGQGAVTHNMNLDVYVEDLVKLRDYFRKIRAVVYQYTGETIEYNLGYYAGDYSQEVRKIVATYSDYYGKSVADVEAVKDKIYEQVPREDFIIRFTRTKATSSQIVLIHKDFENVSF